MIRIMRNLHLRQYKENKIFIKELDECLEVLFVNEGKYDIGYEINKILKFNIMNMLNQKKLINFLKMKN